MKSKHTGYGNKRQINRDIRHGKPQTSFNKQKPQLYGLPVGSPQNAFRQYQKYIQQNLDLLPRAGLGVSGVPLAVHPRHALWQQHVAYGGAMRRIAYNALCGNSLLCKSHVRSQRAANEVEHQEMYNPHGMLYCVLHCHGLCLRSRFLWGDDG